MTRSAAALPAIAFPGRPIPGRPIPDLGVPGCRFATIPTRLTSAWPAVALLACLVPWVALFPSPADAQGVVEEELAEPPPPRAAPPRPVAEPSAASSSAVSSELIELERLADEAFAQDDLGTASALYRQLADRHGDRGEKVRLRMTVAWLEHLQGRRVRTIETLTEVLILDPDFELRPELYSDDFIPIFYDARKRAIQTRESQASKLVHEGSDLLRERRLDEARQRFSRALEIWPDQFRALYNLALVEYHAGNLEAALNGFQRLLSLDAARPGLVEETIRGQALTNLGLVYLDQDLPGEAVGTLEQAVEVSSDSAAAWSNLGVARRRLGDRQGAIAAFRRASELDPADLSSGRNLGLAYLDAGDPTSAVTSLSDTAGRFPDDPGLWLYLGLAQDRLGQRAEARRSFETALQRDPDNAQGWAASAALQLASTTFAQGDWQASAAAAEKAVRWDPEQVNGWVFRGLASQANGQLGVATEALEEAKRRDPGRADIHNSLGSVYFELGRYDEAEAAFRRALELKPSLTTARQNLEAVTAVRRGDAVAGRGSPSPRSTSASPRGSTRNSTGGSGNTSSSRRQSLPTPPRRPDIGLRFADIDYSSLGLQGAMIETVYSDSAAGRAGLKADDLLLEMDGRPVKDSATLRSYLAQLPAGTEVTLKLLRANRPLTVRLVVP